MKVLITGGAGFIGAALAHELLDRGDSVHAIDTLNDYYEVSLKEARLERLTGKKGFSFDKTDISDRPAVRKLFETHKFDAVMNLAAQAGVRYSLENLMTFPFVKAAVTSGHLKLQGAYFSIINAHLMLADDGGHFEIIQA